MGIDRHCLINYLVVAILRKDRQRKNLHSPYPNSNQMDFNTINYNSGIYVVKRYR